MGIDQVTLALKNFELDVGTTDRDQLTGSRLETLPLPEEPLHLLRNRPDKCRVETKAESHLVEDFRSHV